MYNKLLIGKELEVIASSDISLLGRRGIVIDETRNLMVLLSGDGKHRKIPKSIVTFRLYDKSMMTASNLDGRSLIGSQAERLKG